MTRSQGPNTQTEMTYRKELDMTKAGPDRHGCSYSSPDMWTALFMRQDYIFPANKRLVAYLSRHICKRSGFRDIMEQPRSVYLFDLGANLETTIISKDELETALEGASISSRTLIIAVVNRAYVEEKGMLDLFLESFRVGENTEFLLGHLLLATIDQISYDRCNLLHLHCYKLVTDGVDFTGEKLYMSGDFIKMMWRRTIFLADVLRRGYNFIFTDTDVMWLRNPFLRLSQGGEDLQISCDKFNGRPTDIFNPINTGFYFVSSNNKTITLFDKWHTSRNESLPIKEQDVLYQMISTGVLGQLGMTVRFLDTRYFGGFCQSGRDFGQVVTMHANCCRTIKAKTVDLRAFLEEWKKFRGLNNVTSTTGWPNHNACDDSWRVEPNQTSVK